MRLLVLLLLAAALPAMNANHGPFPEGEEPERIVTRDLTRQVKTAQATAERTVWLLDHAGRRAVSLAVIQEGRRSSIAVKVGDAVVIKATPFTDGLVGGPQIEVADLNRDGIEDFYVYGYSGGCGLAGSFVNVAFVLSTETGYVLRRVRTVELDGGDLVVHEKRGCFVHTAFGVVDKCQDGLRHHFWVYHLLRFTAEGEMVEQAHPLFPKTVWFSFKPNRAETTIITDEQKAALREKAVAEMFWRPAEE